MTTRPFDFLIFIGRFQPLHLGHLAVLQQGLERAEKLIVLIGSAWQPRSVRNPWSYAEREAMVHAALGPMGGRVLTAPLMDVPYNDEAWVRNVQSTVQGLVTAHHEVPHRPPRIGLIGHSKDHSSFYLKLFPQWDSVAVENIGGLSSTPLREALFGVDGERGGDAWLKSEAAQVLPAPVRDELAHFCAGADYAEVRAEHAFVAEYRKGWAKAPYAPTFVTVDAVVVQSGHVLLVERKARPGQGLLALPGGFVDQHERLVDACLRELREETRLKVPAPVLKGSIRAQQVFDEPYRSARGRTITHAFLIELEPAAELPKVKGGDDARYAYWLPLADLDPARMFEDHYFIIQHLLGL
ncbi:MAG TPA: bifunctional nicotinamide-nucleotide adenylyltransferase/Nudix hydroxylase [Moraxellaceae bacterium]|nr:bifunctional nicotinamide-nucleotide adenylyltransferase/Nudix hydroxylase [Moraxellaceae bacterium]